MASAIVIDLINRLCLIKHGIKEHDLYKCNITSSKNISSNVWCNIMYWLGEMIDMSHNSSQWILGGRYVILNDPREIKHMASVQWAHYHAIL